MLQLVIAYFNISDLIKTFRFGYIKDGKELFIDFIHLPEPQIRRKIIRGIIKGNAIKADYMEPGLIVLTYTDDIDLLAHTTEALYMAESYGVEVFPELLPLCDDWFDIGVELMQETGSIFDSQIRLLSEIRGTDYRQEKFSYAWAGIIYCWAKKLSAENGKPVWDNVWQYMQRKVNGEAILVSQEKVSISRDGGDTASKGKEKSLPISIETIGNWNDSSSTQGFYTLILRLLDSAHYDKLPDFWYYLMAMRQEIDRVQKKEREAAKKGVYVRIRLIDSFTNKEIGLSLLRSEVKISEGVQFQPYSKDGIPTLVIGIKGDRYVKEDDNEGITDHEEIWLIDSTILKVKVNSRVKAGLFSRVFVKKLIPFTSFLFEIFSSKTWAVYLDNRGIMHNTV